MVNSKKIVLTTFGTLSDLHPAMALAQELQTRGHHVVIATNEAYRSKVERIGINFHPLRPNLPVELGKVESENKIFNPLTFPYPPV